MKEPMMWFTSFLAQWRSADRQTRSTGRKAPRARPGIESLEDRNVPSGLSLLSSNGHAPQLFGPAVHAAAWQGKTLHSPVNSHAGARSEETAGRFGIERRFVLHLESVDGQVTSVVPPMGDDKYTHMTGAGEGWATQLGLYKETFSQDITPADAQGTGLILNGRFTSTAADGSTITGSYSGTYTLLANNMVRYNVTPIWEEGTGRLAGITGEGTAVAVLNLATGAFHVDTVAVWKLP
jgi:hypothetical protein